MSRSAAATAVHDAGVAMDARLALVEFLLASTDLQASARRAIEWLAAFAAVQQAVIAVSESAEGPLLSVAEHGVPSVGIVDFAIDRDDEGHPVVQAMSLPNAVYCDGESAPFRGPIAAE